MRTEQTTRKAAGGKTTAKGKLNKKKAPEIRCIAEELGIKIRDGKKYVHKGDLIAKILAKGWKGAHPKGKRPEATPKPIRMSEADFEGGKWLRVSASHVEIFGNSMDITPPSEMVLHWTDEANNEPGVSTGFGWGYAGWDETTRIHLRYDEGLEGNEHGLRVYEVLGEAEAPVDSTGGSPVDVFEENLRKQIGKMVTLSNGVAVNRDLFCLKCEKLKGSCVCKTDEAEADPEQSKKCVHFSDEISYSEHGDEHEGDRIMLTNRKETFAHPKLNAWLASIRPSKREEVKAWIMEELNLQKEQQEQQEEKLPKEKLQALFGSILLDVKIKANEKKVREWYPEFTDEEVARVLKRVIERVDEIYERLDKIDRTNPYTKYEESARDKLDSLFHEQVCAATKTVSEDGVISDERMKEIKDARAVAKKERMKMKNKDYPYEKNPCARYWVEEGRLQKEYKELYNAHIPVSGHADSSAAELMRLVSCLLYRCYNDGDDPHETYMGGMGYEYDEGYEYDGGYWQVGRKGIKPLWKLNARDSKFIEAAMGKYNKLSGKLAKAKFLDNLMDAAVINLQRFLKKQPAIEAKKRKAQEEAEAAVAAAVAAVEAARQAKEAVLQAEKKAKKAKDVAEAGEDEDDDPFVTCPDCDSHEWTRVYITGIGNIRLCSDCGIFWKITTGELVPLSCNDCDESTWCAVAPGKGDKPQGSHWVVCTNCNCAFNGEDGRLEYKVCPDCDVLCGVDFCGMCGRETSEF